MIPKPHFYFQDDSFEICIKIESNKGYLKCSHERDDEMNGKHEGEVGSETDRTESDESDSDARKKSRDRGHKKRKVLVYLFFEDIRNVFIFLN